MAFFPVTTLLPARRASSRALAAFLAATLAAGCGMLPNVADAPPPAPVANPETGFGPAPGANRSAGEPSRATSSGMPTNLLPPAAGARPPAAEGQAPAKTYPGTGVFINQKPPAPPRPAGPEEASLNFEGLDVREVAKVILGDYLRESYTVHPAVAGTVTFRTIKPIPLKDLLPTLEMLLRQNGAAVVREEGVHKILPIAQVRGSVSPQLGGVALPIPGGFSVLVVPLKFVGAKEMAKLLEPFSADNTVRVDEVRNLVIIAGNQRETKHLLDTIELFDVDWLAGYSVGIFPVKSADVKTLMTDLDKIFGPTAQGPLAGVVRIIPIERMNALLMITTQPRYLETAKSWLERLDQLGGTTGGSRFFVYAVRNGRAENLAQLISDLFSSRRSTTAAPGLAPGARPAEIRSQAFGTTPATPTGTTVTTTTAPTSATFTLGGVGTTQSEVRVIADKDTNSLLILASPADYDVIEGALKKLDVMRRQVLVEVMLAEVTLTDNLSFGIDWFITARNNTAGTLNLGSLPATSAGSPGAYTGLQLVQSVPGVGGAAAQVRAVLRALGQDGKSKILASPQIMVLDNEKAEIKVGDRISVQTQSQTAVGSTGQLVNSFQYLETGILLAVTPRINSGGLVTLDVNQEVSAPVGSGTAANPNPDVSSRNAKTSVVVASGESIVLAGLIREQNRRSSSGIPLLSKIPILGAAFGSQGFDRDRTELVLIITPRIISDTVQAREATEELRKKLPSLEGMLPPPVARQKP